MFIDLIKSVKGEQLARLFCSPFGVFTKVIILIASLPSVFLLINFQIRYQIPNWFCVKSAYHFCLCIIYIYVTITNLIQVRNHNIMPNIYISPKKDTRLQNASWTYPINVYNINWLVVDLPLWKIWKSVGIVKFPRYGKIKNDPNHQPDEVPS